MLCPNCGVDFSENRDKAFLCDSCGWLTEVDGQWHPCTEPAKLTEPASPDADPPREPKPASEPKPAPEPVTRVKSLFGGLVTITEIEDDENEENN